jgi:hypothetical protein
MAQTVNYSVNHPQKLKPSLANKAVLAKQNISDIYDPSFQAVVSNANSNQIGGSANRTFTATRIGQTWYDMQTNRSNCNRIVRNSDGTISATWTMSLSGAALPSADRGTGYNYFNGTTWGAEPTIRLESVRCGWPNVGITNTNKEIIISHEATSGTGNIHVMSRATKGTGAWTESTLGYPDVWPRMAIGGNNGQTIHLISQTTGATPGNGPYHGQDGAIAYSRSLDGGVTWDKLRTVIPQIDSSHYLGFGGDNYAIDVRGDVVAILAGGNTVDLVLLKSTDNGNNWVKTIVKPFAIPFFNFTTMTTDINGDTTADTLETNDGNVAVLIDNQNKVHVWYGKMRVINEAPNTTGISYFPGTDGLMYWNESLPAPVMVASALDIDGDGVLNVSEWGTYYSSLTSQPSAGIDATGKIYLSYSSIFEGIADNGTPGSGKSYRHTYLLRSSDGGNTWCGPLDVSSPSQDDYVEAVYGTLPRNIGTDVDYIFQKDASPGHGLSGNPQGSTDPQGGISDIIYSKIPAADFNALPCYSVVGIKENELNKNTFSVFPNPAKTAVNLMFNVEKTSTVNIKIYNVLGEEVAVYNNESISKGSNLNINVANYKKGIYFVNVIMNGTSTTQKLIVE